MSNASDIAVSTIPPFSTAPHASMTPGQPVPTVGILPERLRGTWYSGKVRVSALGSRGPSPSASSSAPLSASASARTRWTQDRGPHG